MNTIQITPLNSLNHVGFKQKKNSTKIKHATNADYIAGGAALAVTAASILAYKNYSNSYKVRLARDLSKELGQKITTKHLKSIMTNSELLKELSALTEQNYVASKKNIENGIFLADLHSHTKYSDGVISVEKLLNQAAEYGNKLNKINGKKFIFAISDHDGIDGVKEALKLIVQNPQKYENIKFVPAAEMSFIIPCHKNSTRYQRFQSDVQMPEILIYNINPFSNKTQSFFDKIYKSRENQIKKAIEDANSYYHQPYFSTEEYNKFFNIPDKRLCFLNQHWRIWNYIHTKSRVISLSKEKNKNPEVLYETLVKELRQENKHMTPDDLNKYIKEKNIQTQSEMFDNKLKPMLTEKIFPKKTGDFTVESDYEIQFKDLVEIAKEENAFLGFAHPGFTMQNFEWEKCLNGMQNLIKQGQGRVKFAEKYHQSYPIGDAIKEDELKYYNDILDKLKLVMIGGRDNHSGKFI